jgi:hypothetical protein
LWSARSGSCKRFLQIRRINWHGYVTQNEGESRNPGFADYSSGYRPNPISTRRLIAWAYGGDGIGSARVIVRLSTGDIVLGDFWRNRAFLVFAQSEEVDRGRWGSE